MVNVTMILQGCRHVRNLIKPYNSMASLALSPLQCQQVTLFRPLRFPTIASRIYPRNHEQLRSLITSFVSLMMHNCTILNTSLAGNLMVCRSKSIRFMTLRQRSCLDTWNKPKSDHSNDSKFLHMGRLPFLHLQAKHSFSPSIATL